MAGGKQSARQKMINLMYLVFIAMIAMTMSKEVLSAFGLMDKKFDRANELAIASNNGILTQLKTQAEEKPDEFDSANKLANQISAISDDFYKFLGTVKTNDIVKNGGYELEANGDLPYEEMDKGDKLDELWFTGDRLTKRGQEVLDRIEKYKADIKAVLPKEGKWQPVVQSFEDRFSTAPVKDNDGVEKKWLDYHFQGFPAIASYTKLTAMQNDVKATETNIYNGFLGNLVSNATSLKNYTAIVLADKSAFFAGEKFQGKVVLGKYANVAPTKMSVAGKEVDLSKAIDSTGAATLDFNVGNVGEHDIDGKFTFVEDGKELEIPIIGNYVVVPRPNSATISADKMNVVYRGVSNPMTISFAGVPDNKVNATGAGLSKASGIGKYSMNPGTGKEVTINVTAKLDDGSNASDRAVFRIKDIPKPTGTIAGQSEGGLPRNNIEIGTIKAELTDFDFDLPLSVTSFKFKVPGQATVNVNGNKLNGTAKAALRKARRGDAVQIFDIKSKANSSVRIKPASPIAIELAN
ncbi:MULTISPECIES: gliding motility protein GldM [unclassified Olleya]|jgi:gliding motility-associated protein GldM|uniref:type IX secretion system motor protein PorM/GldM n=1 Tax=unclassified Olleya TaxID=2615019 RepID=UPI0011A2F9A0|nr:MULTISPECIES: gliding motility protein GldM [unclassified Olleya]TVZ47522.1 gliding motility-associated protein GldM [Olleya sp. Hel_I_94]|tara:strand:- start:7897 stop:9462 length:1566 start_codon:yes stop_codon:yes gene_type:complete